MSKTPAQMQIPELYAALETARAELRDLDEQTKEAYRRWTALNQQQTQKADEIRALRQELQAAEDTTGGPQ